MTSLELDTFSIAEKTIYINTVKYLNEMTFVKNTACRNKRGKKLKGARKKLRVDQKEAEENKLTEVFEVILGTFKLKVIDHLKVACSSEEIKGWVDRVTPTGVEYFIQNVRESMCREVINVISKNHMFRVSLEVYQWLFKDGVLKVSDKKVSKNSKYSDEVLILKNKYLKDSQEKVESLKLEDLGVMENSVCLNSEIIMLKETQRTSEALKSVLADIGCNKTIFEKLKEDLNQVEDLYGIIVNFINETSEDIVSSEKTIKKFIKNSSYQKRFVPFKEFLSLSCKMTGIEFNRENEEWFISYYENLKEYSEDQLKRELKWLRKRTMKVL
ncbi:hypothetical protein PM10SUCC1_01880 [Propionigenium maris DSM 9537]|uniref:Uncharacterized protein n=1 Tax=Propionigenium maris DSM 9537 TaxID=1123000 RepID=A0A9W6GIC4_9FUSO|nr:hypothetical protein [Propionigenium maris]GLI54673.1 hypothetical protein PM10SUCC1_01880 [Propionigenium maris DSM 9537]